MTTVGWADALGAYGAHMRAGGAAAGTVGLRGYWLRRFARDHPDPWQVTAADASGWLGYPGWRPETRKSAAATLVGFYRWAQACGHTGVDPTVGLPRVTARRGIPRPAPTAVVRAALAGADDRTRLMILLAVLAGLRRSEVAGLHTRDYAAGVLTVRGKGGRVRRVPAHALLAARLELVEAGWVFPRRDGGHLSAVWVGTLLRRALGGGWSAHSLRHAAACAWYEAERDLLAVRDLLGHASVATTQIYASAPRDALVAAVAAAGRIVA